MVLSIIIYVALSLLMLAGLIITPLGLPGNWLILACAVGYGFVTQWEKFGPLFVVLLGVAALVGEILELFSGSIGARKYGSSRRGEVAAFVGSIIGLIVGSGFAPIVGSLIGAFAGAFLGAFLYEYYRLNDLRQSLRAGAGAFLGKTVAVFVKELIGILMVGLIAYHLIV